MKEIEFLRKIDNELINNLLCEWKIEIVKDEPDVNKLMVTKQFMDIH